MNSKQKMTTFIVVLITVLIAVATVATTNRPAEAKLTYSQFLEQVTAGNIAKVEVSSNAGVYPSVMHLKNGQTARTVLPPDIRDPLRIMQDKQVNVEIRDSSGTRRSLTNAIPFLLLLALWVYFLTRRSPFWG
jgi:ATP-dependent Zn protease